MGHYTGIQPEQIGAPVFFDWDVAFDPFDNDLSDVEKFWAGFSGTYFGSRGKIEGVNELLGKLDLEELPLALGAMYGQLQEKIGHRLASEGYAGSLPQEISDRIYGMFEKHLRWRATLRDDLDLLFTPLMNHRDPNGPAPVVSLGQIRDALRKPGRFSTGLEEQMLRGPRFLFDLPALQGEGESLSAGLEEADLLGSGA